MTHDPTPSTDTPLIAESGAKLAAMRAAMRAASAFAQRCR